MTKNATTISANQLREYCSRLFVAIGMPVAEADILADTLVEADLTGVESHGVSRVANYLTKLRAGGARSELKLTAVTDGPGIAVYDAHNSMGAVAAYRAMEAAIEKAKKTGIAFINVVNSNHYGMAGYFAKMAVAHDMIGFTATNSAAQMAPWGGTKAFFGTNPFAMAIPAGEQLPIVADMATSVVARGKIILASKKNQAIPHGWAQTADGEDTTDAKAALLGTVLPFAGPKGYAIATMIEALTGVLAGSAVGPQVKGIASVDEPSRVSHCFMAIDLAAFGAAAEFKQRVDRMILDMKGGPKAKGVAEIYLPGEIEARKRRQRLAEGIVLEAVIVEELKNEGLKCGVAWSI